MQVDAYTSSLLDLIADDDLHANDRAEIERVILAVACEYDGHIDPNVVRRRLPSWVQPQLVGPTYRALCLAREIEPAGWTTSDDLRGRNSGKPARTYRLVPEKDKEVAF
jgi:hypothetical protein